MQDETHETSDPDRLVKNPRVSVLMITFNHAGYLAEAIEGVIGQECNFPFELIIGEDASSDKTRKIAIEYQRRYPAIVRVIHSSNNVGMNANSLRIFARARGQYVAYCEGDDFWCARDKLARQVALIEQDARVGVVHTDWTHAHYQSDRWVFDRGRSVHRHTSSKYLSGNLFQTWYFPKVLRTCTILLRHSTMRDWYDSCLMDSSYPFGDAVLSAWVTSRFRVEYIPEVMAVYRVSANSALRSGAESRVRFYQASLRFDSAARSYFSNADHYPNGYRWESAVGLLAWSARAGDFAGMGSAIREFSKNFTISQFLGCAYKSIRMRLPMLVRQPRDVSDLDSIKNRER